MADILATQNNFKSLAIKDLLQARDLYHYHLMNKPNVVGTAIGLYFIRNDEKAGEKKKGVRTLENSGIRDYSWPCVHAFVRKWVDEDEFGGGSGQLHPETMIPRTLYLPDGRMVPVCVTLVEQGEVEPSLPAWQWPGGVFGGGMPIIVETQERERIATAGGLVSDGHKLYALTSRHVSGDEGEPVFTIARGVRTKIGRGGTKNLSRLPFSEAYPEFTGRRTFVNVDVGLIELDDANAWTSRYLGIGTVDALADLNELNITTRLIDEPVVAVGAASGRMEGRIKALFYRFKSVGGYDYVSDFLIAPADGAVGTKPGDSGAVWHLVTTDDETKETHYRPLAIEWGGQIFLGGDGSQRSAFGLATSLTTVCQSLNVELALEHNTGAMPYWGQLGHYSIAALACEVLKDPALKSFFAKNLESISFKLGEIDPKTIAETVKPDENRERPFVPLADVPDLVWKTFKSHPGGRDTAIANGRSTGPEHASHYADMDQKGVHGKTLRQLCEDEANVSVEAWQTFYNEIRKKEDRDRGLLPFRVWQFFDALVEFASEKDAEKFLCAAGLLSHYVGDACQPLHGSMYADGYKGQKKTITHHKRATGEPYDEETNVGAGVHSAYETKMVDRKSTDLVKGIAKLLGKHFDIRPMHTGKDAAMAVLDLMDRTADRLNPTDIVDTYVNAGDKPTAKAQDALWSEFRDQTIETMTDGATVLAAIWTAAWKIGNGKNIPATRLVAIDPDKLQELYEDPKFVPSLTLNEMKEVLEREPALA